MMGQKVSPVLYTRGVATGVYIGYIYPPKISPSKFFMG